MNLLYLIDVDRIHRFDRTHDVGPIEPDPVQISVRVAAGPAVPARWPERQQAGGPGPGLKGSYHSWRVGIGAPAKSFMTLPGRRVDDMRACMMASTVVG